MAAWWLGISALLVSALTPAHALPMTVDFDFMFGQGDDQVIGTIFGLAPEGPSGAHHVDVQGTGFFQSTGPLTFAVEGNSTEFNSFLVDAGTLIRFALEARTFDGAGGEASLLMETPDVFAATLRDFNGTPFRRTQASSIKTSPVQQQQIPEPATLVLLGAGLLAFRAASRRASTPAAARGIAPRNV